jgi:hypothetical protein
MCNESIRRLLTGEGLTRVNVGHCPPYELYAGVTAGLMTDRTTDIPQAFENPAADIKHEVISSLFGHEGQNSLNATLVNPSSIELHDRKV